MSYSVVYINNLDQETISIDTIEASDMSSAIDIFMKNYGVKAAQILAIMLVNE